ncbi:ABC transporter substrate-binding protein [Rheinheimera sp.]|uniref:substrate-binding periplasmic protein n=1 Tax=Rheinheimera sp. TaxID=1869214 RepID=UPI00307F9C80
MKGGIAKNLVRLILLFATAPAVAAPLRLYTEEFFPYNYSLRNEVLGINADLLKQACQTANLECRFQSLPWLRAYELAQHHESSGVFSIVRTAKRERQFQWVGPLASSNTYLYRLKSRPEVAPADLEQAKAFGVAVTHGDFFEQYLLSQGFKQDKNLLLVQSRLDAVPLFLAGKLDLLISSDQVIDGWLRPYGKSRADVEPVLDISYLGQNYLALNLDVPAKKVKALQQAVDQLRAEGLVEQLFQQYKQEKAPAH